MSPRALAPALIVFRLVLWGVHREIGWAITMPEGAFNSGFDPAARTGDVIELFPRGELWEVDAVGLQPGVTLGSPITVGANSTEKTELTDLEMKDEQLAQLRLPLIGTELPDGVNVTVDHSGAQEPAFEQKNIRGRFVNATGSQVGFDPANTSAEYETFQTQFTELYVYEDNVPYFTVKNTTGNQITFDPTFAGYRYLLTSPPGNFSGQPVQVPVEAVREG